MKQKDVIIIGGGVGGLVTTSVLAQLGLNVALFEKSSVLGGDCLHYGCVPSKTLIHSAKVAQMMRRGPEYGLPAYQPVIDGAAVMGHVQDVIAHIQQHDDPQRFRSYGADVEFGDVKFTGSHQIEFQQQTWRAKRFIISTGSRPSIPDMPGLKDIDYLTNETIFSQTTLPKRLLVMGGGFIAVELSQALARLGVQVTMILRSRLLSQLDEDVAAIIHKRLCDEGVNILSNIQCQRVSQDSGQVVIDALDEQQHAMQISADRILVATGRAKNTDTLDLAAAGINYSDKGINVDSRLRTSAKHIFAVGDVANTPHNFTHMAEYHAGIAISNIAFRWPKRVDNRVVPAVMYSDPEVASVGLNEQQAQQQGVGYEVYEFALSEIDRALAAVEPEGKAKLLLHKGRLVGATIVASHAGELISEFVLTMSAKISIRAISAAIHAYPTFAQVNRRVVNAYYGQQLFSPRTKKIIGWLNRWLP